MLSFQSRTKPKTPQDFAKSKLNLIPRLTTTIKKSNQDSHKIVTPGKISPIKPMYLTQSKAKPERLQH